MCLSWEAVSWSGVFSYEEGAVGLLGKEDVYKLPRNVLDLFKFFAFPTLTSSLGAPGSEGC